MLDAVTAARAVEPDRPMTVDVGDRPVVLTGDAHRLRQVVDNLLANVGEHTAPTTGPGEPVTRGAKYDTRRHQFGVGGGRRRSRAR